MAVSYRARALTGPFRLGGYKGKVARGYIWGKQWARRESKRGQKGIDGGIRKDLGVEESKIEIGREGVLIGHVRVGEEN